MRAALVREPGSPFRIEEVQIADPIGREVLVELRAAGLCHSDLFSAHSGHHPFPALYGHEPAGIVTAVGPQVTEFSVGDHVVGCLIQYCGRCRRCLGGRVTECQSTEATLRADSEPPRLSVDGDAVYQGMALGGFAQQMLVHEAQLVQLPKDMPWAQAALIGCGVVTGAGTVLNTARVEAGSSVVILGAGGVGLSAISGARVAGATTIIAVDISEGKLDRAQAFGATHVVNSAEEDSVRRVREITDGADYVIDCVGAAGLQRQGLDMLTTAGGGRLYLVGVGTGTAGLELSSFEMLMGKYRIEGAYMGSTNPKSDIPMYVDLYQQDRFNLDDLVTQTIRLSEIDEAYKSLSDPSVARIVVTDFEN
ncbi:Zn-dependent alcohol dehydrogenase [Aeromicrobium sp. YIM 150415]|uniref:zinc-binding dehydrogenase n=1 Tax=Aeromicrobium sp. YIM 150415 TaxID=2803912 RepID=UPI0019638565|nr:Zn-dependent alcohol dehydrogenase [Aeromicrobium sp. YIM 150415]MBM9464074.1 Zn-dependent alcohol dehydrogenase [Aeromicrobium sp. YIM 150415]